MWLAIYSAVTNVQDITHYVETYVYVVAYGGHNGAYMFLWISGFLTTLCYSKSEFSFTDIPLRLLRLLPVFWMAMFISWKVVPSVIKVNSPLWHY